MGQPCFFKQCIALRPRWKLRGFLSGVPSERCDAILKGFCLFDAAPLHRASPLFEEGGSSTLSVAETAKGREAIVLIW